MQADRMSYRDVEQLTGISASTLCRFDNGKLLTFKNFDKLNDWFNGKISIKSNPISVKRFRVGRKTFLVTIEEITTKPEPTNE